MAILTAACIIFGTALAFFWVNTERAMSASEASRQAVQARTEAYLKELEAKKKAAEEKAAEEDAADAAAASKDEEKEAVNAGPTAESAPGGCNPASLHTNPAAIDVMVNKKHCLVPLSFTPPDLVTSHGATLSAKAIDAFNQMFAAATADGQPFIVSSSYRSYATQVSTYNYWVSVNGQQAADTVSARPGYSEHQTGFALDVGVNGCELDCFGSTSQYQWFQANAASFGFIQRYYAGFEATTGYASEEWHYRYVGVSVAQDMKAKGIKTLEEYWGLEGGNYR